MARQNKAIRMTGTLAKDGCIHPDSSVPLPPGPVRFTLFPAGRSPKRRRKKLKLMDLYGSARGVFRGANVEEGLQRLRDEWDRKTR